MIKIEDIQQYGKEHFETLQSGFQAIAGAYDALAAAEPERFRVLDAGAEPAGVLAAAQAALADLG